MGGFFAVIHELDHGIKTATVWQDGSREVIEPGALVLLSDGETWAGGIVFESGPLAEYEEEVLDSLHEALYRGNDTEWPSREAVVEQFKTRDLVAVSARHEQDGRKDWPARSEAWAYFVRHTQEDLEHEHPKVPSVIWEELLEQPDDLDAHPIATLRQIMQYCEETGCDLKDVVGT